MGRKGNEAEHGQGVQEPGLVMGRSNVHTRAGNIP